METAPTFLVIGAPKCATTSLHLLLDSHPAICMSKVKEPRFFSHSNKYNQGWPWYKTLFDVCENTVAVGESSTDYGLPSRYPHLIPRIKHHLPHVKLIYLVRNPIRRIESEWKMKVAKGDYTGLSINEAVRADPALLDASRYWRQLCHYLREFPRERILVAFFEEFAADRQTTVNTVLRHVGVSGEMGIDWRTGVAQQRRADRSKLLTSFRKSRVFGIVRDWSPAPIREAFRVLLTSPSGVVPIWDAAELRRIVDELQPDAEKLLQYCKMPLDYWAFDVGTSVDVSP